jgi:hypothetical protein
MPTTDKPVINKEITMAADYEQQLCEALDQCIQEGALGVALELLYGVKDTFSKYVLYMQKVNALIK